MNTTARSIIIFAILFFISTPAQAVHTWPGQINISNLLMYIDDFDNVFNEGIQVNDSLQFIYSGKSETNFYLKSYLGAPLSNWDDTQNHSKPIIYATGGITGFDPAFFNLDTSGFTQYDPVLPGSSFSFSQAGKYVYINYTVPEPSTITLLGIGAFSLLIYTWRRWKQVA